MLLRTPVLSSDLLAADPLVGWPPFLIHRLPSSTDRLTRIADCCASVA
jgi:hypothetical protein